MDDDDVHLCLACNQTIIGLLNYIVHKKSQCPSKKQHTTVQKNGRELSQQTDTGRDSSNPISELTISFSGQTSPPSNTNTVSTLSSLREIVSAQFLTASTSSAQQNYIFSTAGQNVANTVFSETSQNYLSSEKSVTNTIDFSNSVIGSLAVPSTSNNFSVGSAVLGNKVNNVNSLIATLASRTSALNLPTENICTDSTIGIVSLAQSVSLPDISPIEHNAISCDMQQTSSSRHSSGNPPGSSTVQALTLELHSPLSRYINANLSPVSGVVSPNTVMPQTSVGNCEDFFQSLELQSKSQHSSKPGAQGRHSIDEDEMDLDLPISRILSSLDFSSDEDLVDFPLDGSFGDISDDEDNSHYPPSSHTGGKWKPGEGPVHSLSRKNSFGSRWRRGSFSSARMGHGGKWKPGMSQGKLKSTCDKIAQDKVYECQACEVSFHNRFQYSHHCSTQSHKVKISGRAPGGKKGYHCSACSVSLPSRFSYSNHCRKKSHKYNVKCQEPLYSQIPICAGDGLFDTEKSNKYVSSNCEKSSMVNMSFSGDNKECDDNVFKGQITQQENNSKENAIIKVCDKLQCKNCQLCFENSTDFWVHCEICKLKSSLPKQHEDIAEKMYTCTICSQMFRNRFAYSRHQGLCKTKSCNRETSNDNGSADTNKVLENTIATKHSDEEKKPDLTNERVKPLVIRLYYCSVCKHSFKSRPLYVYHCAICRSATDNHLSVITNSCHCCCCSVSYKTDAQLADHYRTRYHKLKESSFLENMEVSSNTDPEAKQLTDIYKNDEKANEKSHGDERLPSLQTVIAQKQKHECLVCNKSFTRLYDIIRHLLTRFHRNRAINHPQVISMLQKYHRLLLRLSPFQCGICQFFFNRDIDFQRHFASDFHCKNCSAIVGQIMCVSCKYSSFDHKTIPAHIASESHQHLHRKNKLLCIVKEKKRQIKCQYCGIVMDSRKRMRKHVSFRHPQGIPAKAFVKSKGRNEPKCPTCGKTFFSPSALALHISRVHLNNKPYSCKLCNKFYKSKMSLIKHSKGSKHISKVRKNDEEKNSSSVNVQASLDDNYVIIENDVAIDAADGGMKAESNKDGGFGDGKSIQYDQGKGYKQIDEEQGLDEDYINNKLLDNMQTTLAVKCKGDTSLNSLLTEKETKMLLTEKVFRCEMCIAEYLTLDDLRDHVEMEHPENVFTCTLCNSIFLSRKAFRIHCSGKMHQEQLVTQGTSEQLFKCSECSMQFVDEKWRNFHFQYQHNHLNSEESLADVQRGKDQVSQKYGPYLSELYYLPNNAQVACIVCEKLLKKEYLREHLRQHTGEKPFACKLCDKAFVARLSLRRHLMCHFGLLDRNCGICGKHFKKTDQFKTHMQEHMNKDKGQCHMCDICGMVFPLEKQVVHHMKRHGERKFSCPYKGCAWKFVLKSELQVHIYSHTGEKKYLCDTCGNGFATKTRLVRHVRTHTQERNYHCEHCSYKAGSRTHLHRHMRIHLGSKPFKCPYCSYTCNTHENVRKHITKTRKHAGLKIYPCKFCSYGSNIGKDFRNHLMLTHPLEIKGLNLEALSVFTGLYNRSDDVKHVDGMTIIQIPDRKPRTAKKKQGSVAKLKEHNAKPDVSTIIDTDAHVRQDSSSLPVCNMESYWSLQQPHQTHWLTSDKQTSESAAKFLGQDSDLLSFHNTVARNNNMMMSTSSTHMTGYDHLGDHNVADVVIVSSNY